MDRARSGVVTPGVVLPLQPDRPLARTASNRTKILALTLMRHMVIERLQDFSAPNLTLA